MTTKVTKAEEEPPPVGTEVELLRAPIVSQTLDVSLAQVYLLYHKGQLPGTRIGRAIRFPKHLLMAYIEKQTTGATQ